MVNPLGTVTTITESPEESVNAANEFTEAYSSGAYIHENCDESMFRPYVAVISGTIDSGKDDLSDDQCHRPTPIGQKLIVPVFDGTESIRQTELARREEFDRRQEDAVAKFEQMSLLNKKDKSKNVECNNKVKAIKTDSGRDGNIDNSNSGSNSGGKEKRNFQASSVTKLEDIVVIEKKFDGAPPPVAPRKAKEIKSYDSIVEPISVAGEVPDVVTIKIGKKSSNISAKFSEETTALKRDDTSVSATIDIKPILNTPESKKADEMKRSNVTQKNKKLKSTESPPKEDITLITDDVLNDEDVQPIIESAKITLSDIMRADTKRKEEKEKQREKEMLKEKQKEKEKSPMPTSMELSKRDKNRKFSIDDDNDNRTTNINTEQRTMVIVEENTMKMSPSEDISELQPKPMSEPDNNKSKKANRKQKKLEKLAADAARVSPSSDSPLLAKSETTEFTFVLKKNSIPSEFSTPAPIEFVDVSETSSSSSSSIAISKAKSIKPDDSDDIAILENFDKTLTGDFTHIQDSLLNPMVSATISLRKQTSKERADSEEKTGFLTKKEKKKNAKNKEIDTSDSMLMQTNNKSDTNLSDPECSFVEPIETLEPDSLSFKSTTDDPVSLINFESHMQDSIIPIAGAKLIFDDTESNADGQFSDCKSFDLVADEQPLNALKQSDTVSSFDLVLDDAYTQLKQSDTNSSDETEDSSQGKNIKSTNIHGDDEELQPLISSTTNLQIDTMPDTTIEKIIDALPDETNQSDSTKHQQSNKKKSRKKRR